MEILEFFICKYYNYSHTILGITGVLLLGGTIVASRFLKENIRYVINGILQNVFFAIAIVSVAELFYLLGLTPEINYVHFNVMIFALVVLMIVLYGFFQGMMFKKVKVPVLQACKNIEYMIWFEIFLLTITKHLELMEWLTAVLVIMNIELLHMISKKIEKNKEEKEIVLKESDYPNPDLFYTRKRQLEKFIPVLEQQKKDPYAIMIAGEWGVGKSSFVKALEKRLEDDIFVWIVEIVLGIKYGFLILQEKTEKILNHMIYNVDVIDFLQVKSEREKYLSELYNHATLDNVMKYLEYSQTYDDFKKIIEVCANQTFGDYKSREDFIRAMLNSMNEQSRMFEIDNIKFWDLSKQIIGCIKQWKLSETEKRICIYGGRMIIRRVIIDNAHFLKNILMMLFDVTIVELNWKTLGMADVDDFYTMLEKIDSNSVYKGLENKGDKLLSIKTYYTNLGKELQKEKYADSGLDFVKIFNEVELIFEICMFWNNMETVLSDDNEEDSLFEQYFVLGGGYYFKDITFRDVNNLKQALELLNAFYESKKNAYKSNNSLLLLGLLQQMVLIYEKDKAWYQDKKEELDNLLICAAKKCYVYDKLEDKYASKAIDEIKVLVYKFCYDCKKNETSNNIKNLRKACRE